LPRQGHLLRNGSYGTMDHQEAGLSHMVRPSWGHRSLDPEDRLLLRCARLDLDDRARGEVEAIVDGGE
jgi:hypothetical protein